MMKELIDVIVLCFVGKIKLKSESARGNKERKRKERKKEVRTEYSRAK